MLDRIPIRRLGVIGGVGPKATARLYIGVVHGVRARTSAYPSILIDSLQFDTDTEANFVGGVAAEDEYAEFGGLLRDSIARLSAAGADCITIPCNTLHMLVEPIVREHGRRFLHALVATVDRAKSLGYRNAAVLATSTTRRADLYGFIGASRGIEVVYPEDDAQAVLAESIETLLREGESPAVIATIESIIDDLPAADCVILGCTDLSLVSRKIGSDVPILDSLGCLVDDCVDYLTGANDD